MWLEEASGLIQSGMSGSPIVDDNGAAIGVVCLSERAPNPRLVHHLPVGLLRQMTRPRPKPVLPPHIAAKLAAAS